jgi:hypothetical protein
MIRSSSTRSSNHSLTILSVSFLLLLLSALAFGQGGASTGDLHVTVKDPKGNLVTNAKVTVSDAAKAVERTATGDGQGGYSARQLPPGTYAVTVEAAGFGKAEAKDVSITVGGLVELPVALAVATGREVVEVSSQAELVETSRTSTTDTIGQRRIDNLPINGRNYINFTLTDSQVVRDNAPNTGAAPTSGLNMSGQRGRSNLVNVDGADATDNSTNGVRSTVSQEAVQEFQIITNNYTAEYGRAAGGVVNIITRSGSNDFHGDIFGYLRNRNFQAVNPFAFCPSPPCSKPDYTRVQAGAAFGGPIKKDKTYFYFSYEITRRHETGFSSIGQANPGLCSSGGNGSFGLCPFDASAFFGAPPGSFDILATGGPQGQAAFLQQFVTAPPPPLLPFLQSYVEAVGASSGMAVNGAWPLAMGGQPGFISSCTAPPCSVPAAYQSLTSQEGNFPVFEGTSLYSLRLDHNISQNNRLMLRVNVSPSTITGIEVNGENQVFGQNSFSRTSEQTYRDVAGTVQDTATIGNNRVNEFRFQYARRGLSYFYNTSTPDGGDIAVDVTGFAYFGREPYSYVKRTEDRYQFTDNFSWTMGAHNTKFGVDFNYVPLKATFTVNYGGVYSFSDLPVSLLGFPSTIAGVGTVPGFSAVQAYGLGIPEASTQGLGNPKDSFSNKPLGLFWQDAWRVRPNLTFNYGVRYDVEFPPQLTAPTGLALSGYNALGLQKGIQTDWNNIQPRLGVAWDPKGDGKTVVRASYGMFYDHPLLGLYFLGDASDGSSSGQTFFFLSAPCTNPANVSPLNISSTNLFQGILGNPGCLPPGLAGALGYQSTSTPTSACAGEANPQRFDPCFPNSLFLNQGYLSPTTGFPLIQQPFGYPQAKNFVYAYAQQANFSVERDLGGGFSLNLAYNFNGGRHLNRPINANTVRGDLLVRNWQAAVAAATVAGIPQTDPNFPSNPLFVGTQDPTVLPPCGANPAAAAPGQLPAYVPAALVSFFRPSGFNPSLMGVFAPCVPTATSLLQLGGLSSSCNGTTLVNCIPFSDMDANYSNGSSVYHGFSANLRKRFNKHYEFLASYTWSHAIDDSTDLESPLAPQDSYFPAIERSNSLFDQRHRFVFSGVYQSGHLSGKGFPSRFLSDWTLAPIIEFSSGRPFNLTTGSFDNFQFVSSGGRPNAVPSATPTNACGDPTYASKVSPTGFLQEPCFADPGVLAAIDAAPIASPIGGLALDGNLGRNAGIQPWTIFNDMRVAKRIYFGERYNMELIADTFNIANRFNVAAVNQLISNAGQATAAYDPRQFQFALKLNW